MSGTLVLSSITASAGEFQLTGSLNGVATLFVAPATNSQGSKTFSAASWSSQSVKGVTAIAQASYMNFLSDGNTMTSVVSNDNGSSAPSVFYGAFLPGAPTSPVSYTETTPSGVTSDSKISAFAAAYPTGVITGSAVRRIVALQTASAAANYQLYWSTYGSTVNWQLTDFTDLGTVLPNAIAMTNTDLTP